jgi:hypothetical protein
MSYRKLELNGRTYEWVVGKDFLKVKGVGIWPKAEVGTPAASRKRPWYDQYVVGPAHVICALTSQPPPKYECREHPGRSGDFLAADPFDDVIHDRITHVPNCPTCLERSAEDI